MINYVINLLVITSKYGLINSPMKINLKKSKRYSILLNIALILINKLAVTDTVFLSFY